MTLSKLRPEDVDESMETSSESQMTDLSSHDEVVIQELLLKGTHLSRVMDIYKDRLSEEDIIAVARRFLIEMCLRRDEEDGIMDTGSTEHSYSNRTQHFCDVGLEILRRSPSDRLMGSEVLKHHIANFSQSAPEEFFDPISSDMMRDPVVISTGFVVDRSTALQEGSGNLQFRTCPWSRERLNPNVFPALGLKRRLTAFKSDRIVGMIETAALLLKARNEGGFCRVIELAHDFIEDIGPKGHSKLAIQLAELGLGTLDLTPCDNSKLSILQPSLLTKLLLTIHSLKAASGTFWLAKVVKMRVITQRAIDSKYFEQAGEWLGCCEQLQDQCKDLLTGDKEIPVALMRLILAKKRGDSDLVPFQRRVYLDLLSKGQTAAALKFLMSERVDALALRDLSPCIFRRGALSSDIRNDLWHEGCRSTALEAEVSHVFVNAIKLRDQGWGNCKGRAGLALYSPNNELIARRNLFGTVRSPRYAFGEDPYLLLKEDEEVVSKCTPGCYYKMEFTVGGGGGHSLELDSFTCKIFYKEWFLGEPKKSYRMHDPEGDAGVFIGKVNKQGVAHGIGRLEYDNGVTFIGTFANGLMNEGTRYFDGKAIRTMLKGKWTPDSHHLVPDQAIVAKYPLDLNDITE